MVACPACGQENPDIATFCLACATALKPSVAEEVRKTVTIVFSDLVGSTSLGERLDSEVLREVMTRYFSEMRRVLERHGGVVEKYIGDAIMAVFGLPRVREDDALRAVRAAAEMGSTLVVLNQELQARWGVQLIHRIGVNTGEVVAGDASTNQRLVAGDAVNVAARLEQAAPHGHVLIGERTKRLVMEHVDLDPVDDLALKGKAERVPAYLLLGFGAEERPISRAELIGRTTELRSLEEALDSAITGNRCMMFTVLGEAGAGKSHLLETFSARATTRATILRGACLSYGDSSTFSPVIEVLRQATRDGADGGSERERLESLLQGEPEKEAVAERLVTILGLSEATFPVEEWYWAVRKLLVALARRRPLVVVLEDLHWAEPTMLALVDHIVEFAEEVPLLLLGAARPEFRDERSDLSAASSTRGTIELGPLAEAESKNLLEQLLDSASVDEGIASAVLDAAEGNPLFVEQIVAMLVEEGRLGPQNGGWAFEGEASDLEIPPSIGALLDARLDRLLPDERATAQRASVIGQIFYDGALRELSSRDVDSIDLAVGALERKGLIGNEPSDLPSETAHAFRHALIRDAAYRRNLKRLRAELHEAFADWLEARTYEHIGRYEEVIGYHLEQAYRYRIEIAATDERSRRLAERARAHLASAGTRAMDAGDVTRTIGLLDRAASLPSASAPLDRLALLEDLVEALNEAGDMQRAESLCAEALALAQDEGDERVRARADVIRLRLALQNDPSVLAALGDESPRLLEVFERVGDDIGLMKSWRLVGVVNWARCQAEGKREASLRSLRYAQRVGSHREEILCLDTLATCLDLGPTPVDQAILEIQQSLTRCESDRSIHADISSNLAVLIAMTGDFSRARDLWARSREVFEDLGALISAAEISQTAWRIEMLADDFDAAERVLLRDYAFLVDLGDRWGLPTNAAMLARSVYAQGRLEEAASYADASEQIADPDDVITQIFLGRVRGLLAASQGHTESAERFGDEAARLAATTDFLMEHGDTLVDLAEIRRLCGHPEGAMKAAHEALGLYERKGSTVAVEKTKKKIADLQR
jgi:class 3 adenylate cyclase/tetratricopeptide (TPR) repeat protein